MEVKSFLFKMPWRYQIIYKKFNIILKMIDTILTKLFTHVQSGNDKEPYTKFYALNQA